MRETEYNQTNGVTETTEATDDGKIHVYQQEDVSGVIERCKQAKDSGSADQGIKKNLWCWASIPTTVCYELIKKGLNPFDRNVNMRRLEAEIDRNYPAFKMTRKRVH